MDKLQRLFEQLKQRVVSTTPQEWIIAAVVAFFCTAALYYLGRNKDESVLSFTVIIYTAAITLVAQLVKKEELHNQWAWSVLILSLLDIILPQRKYFYLFVVGAIVPLIHWIKAKIR